MKNKGHKGKEGKIYILRSPYHKDALVKIGRTSRVTEKRAKEISSATGVPYDFEVMYEEDVFDSHLAEKIIHKKLDNERVNNKREFFLLPLKNAVKMVFEICMEVNSEMLESASDHILLAITLDKNQKNFIKNLKVALSNNLNGTVNVVILYETQAAAAMVTLGDEWRVNLTPELINQLKALKSIKYVTWKATENDRRFIKK